MAKIDLERFVGYLLEYPTKQGEGISSWIRRALKDQGLIYTDGKIVTVCSGHQEATEISDRDSPASKNERIRKAMIDFFKSKREEGITVLHYGVDIECMIAWLEKQGEHANFINKIQIGDKVTRNAAGVLVNLSQLKRVAKKDENQGEQKPADKVEPKFHEGDWVVIDGEILHITNITEDGYSTEEGGHIPFRCEKDARLWTIQDAKDGDVLASKDGDDILIFRNVESNVSFSSYYNIVSKIEHYWLKSCFIPATKEQRDKLEKAMADAGYTFDFEKKELKKIEQKSSWSEEDERNLQGIIDEIEANKNQAPDYDLATYDRFLSWLKSLKDRVRPKQEWSEEDEDVINLILSICNDFKNSFSGHISAAVEDDIKKIEKWLKSLRPQNKWKPSDEQMVSLARASNRCVSVDDANVLIKLLEQLKKLKG